MKAVGVLFSGSHGDAVAKERADALRLGLLKYFPDTLCHRGHTEGRFARHGQCVACSRDRGRVSALKKSRENPEENRRKAKEWQQKNKDRANARKLEWYYANKGKKLASARKFRKANPEKFRIYSIKRRALKLNAPGDFTPADIDRIWNAQRRRCALCCIKITVTSRTIDHIIALANGGSNHPKNLQLLCLPCNTSKWARDPIDHARRKGMLL